MKVSDMEGMMDWIDVNDYKPKGDGEFIVCDTALGVGCADFLIKENYKTLWLHESGTYKHVTHWMPLPQPPDIIEKAAEGV